MLRRAIVVLILGVLSLLAFSAPVVATTHVITQQGIQWVPSTVIVLPGDKVRWQQTQASHTVTNGTGSGDPNAGTLFDAPLGPATPTFEYTFNVPGEFPFFCRPHEFFGMTGKVIVDAPTPDEPITWGRLKERHGVPTVAAQ